MKNSDKKLKLMMGLMISLFLFSACQNSDGTKENQTPSVKNNNIQMLDDESKEYGSVEDVQKEGTEEPSSAVVSSNIQPNDSTEVMIYVVDAESAEIVPVTALIASTKEITPGVIVNEVVEAMADQSLDIGIDEVSIEDDTVIVSFQSDKVPVVNVGSGYEISILNAIAQSIIDNTEGYKNVIYRIEGEAYVTGHISLDVNEVFLGDK